MTWEMQALVNENRLNNAISKVGNVTLQDKPRVRQLFDEFVGDVMEQLETNYEDDMKKLTKTEKDQLLTNLKNLAEILMKRYFVKTQKKT